ncbi:MAG: tryptophan 7-halogenase [candidate division KSB1 bacterium]
MIAPNKKHDVVIVGAGPGGAGSALFLLQQGLKPVIIEKESFPRYHIGESLTGECGVCLRKLGLEDQLLKQNNPIKYGVTVYGTGGKNSFWVPVAERTPEDEIKLQWTWQVRRSEFDKLLLDLAIAKGAEYRQCEAVAPLQEDRGVTGLRVRTPNGAVEDLHAEVVLDASGQGTFLANRGVTSPKERGPYDKQLAIFSQVKNTMRDPGKAAGNTLIFYQKKHHWAWFIPLDDEVVSIGAVVPGEYFKSKKLSKEDFLRQEMLTLNPEMTKRVPDLNFLEETRSISNYSYEVKNFTGKGFLCVGDSHRFIDPIFSFGLYFAMKEAEMATATIAEYLAGKNRDAANPFAAYERIANQGQDVVQDLVDCFWDFPLAFLMFAHQRYTKDIIDCFAGRIYGDYAQNLPGVKGMRSLLSTRQNQAMAAA